MAPQGRILVVEDDSVTMHVLSDTFRAAGFQVLTAQDGSEGLARARAERPDLIILDVMMPRLDGFKVCRLLKSDRNYRHIPIIILTAKAGATDADLSRQAGADCHLVKPFDPDVMLGHVKHLLEATSSGAAEGHA